MPISNILRPAQRRSSPDLTTYLRTPTRSSNEPFLCPDIYVRYPLVPDSILWLFDGLLRATDHLLFASDQIRWPTRCVAPIRSIPSIVPRVSFTSQPSYLPDQIRDSNMWWCLYKLQFTCVCVAPLNKHILMSQNQTTDTCRKATILFSSYNR